MKTPKFAAYLLLLAAAPFAVLADSATDRQIEQTAKASYNYRNNLGNDVKIKANDGVVLFYADEKIPTQNVFYWKGDSYDHAQVDYN